MRGYQERLSGPHWWNREHYGPNVSIPGSSYCPARPGFHRLIDWNADYFESKRQDLIDFEQELKEKREEALQNRIENYSSGFEALNKNAKPFKENISKKYSLKVSEYYSKLTNAFESLPKTVKETFEQKDGYFVVLREVKIDGYEPVIFKKVVHDWGGKYYFRNGLSITDLQFELLTSTENDFAPSFDERK